MQVEGYAVIVPVEEDVSMLTQRDEAYTDVGYGKPIETSSTLKSMASSPLLVPARHPGGMFFHTDFEDRPFIIVDLEVIRPVKRIRVFNTDALPARAVPTSIQVSDDKLSWHEISLTTFIFGGRQTNLPLVLNFREAISCRFIKVQANRETFLHLDYIEISLKLPDLEFGRYQNLTTTGTHLTAEYHHHDSHGFSWTFTCTLGAIVAAKAAGFTITKIDYSRCMLQFKDNPRDEVYSELFCLDASKAASLPDELPTFERHGVYGTFPLGILKDYVDAYFRPSEMVLALQGSMVQRYNIVLDQSIILVYRGTDKNIEVAPAPIEDYIAVARHLLATHPEMRVIIQTDQSQAAASVLASIPGSLQISDLPVTSGTTALHNLPLEKEFGITRSNFSARLLATICLISRAKFVVTHTGNMGGWIALYRGNSNGLYQFCTDMVLRGPGGDPMDIPSQEN